MPSTKDIRRRISSIKNTNQITKAMELVAAAKMRKAQTQAISTRTYANLAWDLLKNVSKKADSQIHQLLIKPEKIIKTGIVLITSNRGLIGGFNNHVIQTALEYARSCEYVECISLGKKGRDAFRKFGYGIAADFEKIDALSSVEDIGTLAKLVIDDFVSRKYDRVTLIYMDFISILSQKPHIRELLPLVSERDETLGIVSQVNNKGDETVGRDIDYSFEPSPDSVLESLLPKLVEMQIYQAVLETNAAEHSARMVAMKNASEAAVDLISELSLEYNQLRQAAITKEISEIVGGQVAIH